MAATLQAVTSKTQCSYAPKHLVSCGSKIQSFFACPSAQYPLPERRPLPCAKGFAGRFPSGARQRPLFAVRPIHAARLRLTHGADLSAVRRSQGARQRAACAVHRTIAHGKEAQARASLVTRRTAGADANSR
jgi:hypothetical protein